MKQLFSILAICVPVFLTAQTSGTIIYEQTVKFEVELPEGMAEQFKDMIPSSQSSLHTLYFNENESLYKDHEKTSDETTTENNDENTSFKMVIMQPENSTYINRETNKMVDSRDFMGKKFLVKDEVKKRAWKLTGQQKQVGKYICQEAQFEQDSSFVLAYFTPQIPISVGPATYAGLPGAVLEIIADEGNLTIVAKEVTKGQIPADIIQEPKKGKVVTDEEYEKIMDKKLKELGHDGEGGTSMKIEIRG